MTTLDQTFEMTAAGLATASDTLSPTELDAVIGGRGAVSDGQNDPAAMYAEILRQLTQP